MQQLIDRLHAGGGGAARAAGAGRRRVAAGGRVGGAPACRRRWRRRVAATDGLFDALDIAEIAEAHRAAAGRGQRTALELGQRLGLQRLQPADRRPAGRQLLGDAGQDRARRRPGRACSASSRWRCWARATAARPQMLQAWEERKSPELDSAQRLLAELADAQPPTWRCCRWRCGSCATWPESEQRRCLQHAREDLCRHRAGRVPGAAAAHGPARRQQQRVDAAAQVWPMAAGAWPAGYGSGAPTASTPRARPKRPSAARSARSSATATSSVPIPSRGRRNTDLPRGAPMARHRRFHGGWSMTRRLGEATFACPQ